MLANEQLRTWLPTSPVMEQPVKDGSRLQLRSPPAGSGSFTVTPVAVPAPSLLTVMSKPMVSPALTGPAGLAVLVMLIEAQLTVTEAEAWPPPSLPDAAVAVLLTRAQSALVVPDWTWIGPSVA